MTVFCLFVDNGPDGSALIDIFDNVAAAKKKVEDPDLPYWINPYGELRWIVEENHWRGRALILESYDENFGWVDTHLYILKWEVKP